MTEYRCCSLRTISTTTRRDGLDSVYYCAAVDSPAPKSTTQTATSPLVSLNEDMKKHDESVVAGGRGDAGAEARPQVDLWGVECTGGAASDCEEGTNKTLSVRAPCIALTRRPLWTAFARMRQPPCPNTLA